MKKVGFIAGTFDVMHPGYIKMFREAKELVCDQLYVLLNAGSNMKTYDKPDLICTLEERRLRLDAIKYVDGIIIYNGEPSLNIILQRFVDNPPDPDARYIRILGSDYLGKEFTGMNLDMDVYFLTRDHDWSTKKYKKLIAESYIEYESKK